MKLDRTQEEAVRRLGRDKANKPLDKTPTPADIAEDRALAFDGSKLYIRWHDDWYEISGFTKVT